jgi:hypothetical protein
MAYFGETGKDSVKVLDYFEKNGAPCEPDVNPAEHIVEVIQGNAEKNVDWVEVWNQSEERQRAVAELEALNNDRKANTQEDEDQSDFATSRFFQFKMVLQRLMTQLWRSPVSHKLPELSYSMLILLGLYVEQGYSACFCSSFQRIYILENGQR